MPSTPRKRKGKSFYNRMSTLVKKHQNRTTSIRSSKHVNSPKSPGQANMERSLSISKFGGPRQSSFGRTGSMQRVKSPSHYQKRDSPLNYHRGSTFQPPKLKNLPYTQKNSFHNIDNSLLKQDTFIPEKEGTFEPSMLQKSKESN